jgi:hypothetical protein
LTRRPIAGKVIDTHAFDPHRAPSVRRIDLSMRVSGAVDGWVSALPRPSIG